MADWEPVGDPQPLGFSYTPPPVPVPPSLAPIYHRESGGNFRAQNPTSTASGAGQDIDSTWKEAMHGLGYGMQWAHAKDAPPEVQNAANIWLQGKYGNKPWAASEPGARSSATAATIASGNWAVSPSAIEDEQKAGHDVVWMTPAEYLAMTPPAETQSAKMRALLKSLDGGEEVHTIPSLDVKKSGETAEVEDQDGRNRAMAAQTAGVNLMPVAIKGDAAGAKTIRDMRGADRPFDFEKVISSLNPIASAKAAEPPKVGKWEPVGDAVPVGQWTPTGSASEPAAMYQAGKEARTLQPDYFGAGLRTDLGSATQFVSHFLPEGVTDTINSINNRLADLGVPLARVPAGGIDEMERQRQAALVAQRGPSPTLGEIAGEALPLVAMGAAVPGASLAARIGTGAGLGALGGLLSPTTSQNYGAEKAGQVVSGGLLGAIAAPVVDMVAPLARWAARLVGAGKPTAAADAVLSRLGPGAPTAQDMMDTLAASQKPLTLADLSKRLANLAGRVSRAPGEAADIVQQNLGARASARGARVYGDVSQNVGSANLYEAATALSQARSAAAKPLFEAALQPGSTAPIADILKSEAADATNEYNAALRERLNLTPRLDEQGRPVYRVTASPKTQAAVGERTAAMLQRPPSIEAADARVTAAANRLREVKEAADAAAEAKAAGIRGAIWSPRLGRLMANLEMKSGISTGLRTLRNEADARGQPFNPRDFAITGMDASGEPIVSKVPNMRLLQAAKIGLEQKVEEFRNPVTGRLDLTQLGRSQAELLAALRDELHMLNPAYAKADAVWSGISKQRDAAMWGSKILNMDKSAIRDRMAKFSPDEQEFARLGMGSMLHDYLEKTNASPARIGALLSDLYKGRLEPMFRTPGDFDAFTKALQDERTMAATDTRVLGNSLTAERVAEDSGPAAHHGMMIAASALLHHNPLSTAWHASRLIASKMRGSSPVVDAEIARLLTSPASPGSASMGLLQRASSVLPNVRRLYLGQFAAGPAGQYIGSGQ